MNKDAVKQLVILLAAVFLKCEGELWYNNDTLEGHAWTTRGGHLFVEAGSPPRYLRQRPRQEELWSRNSWIVHDNEKPEDVEIIPVSSELENQIAEEINVRRAKTLLGAYFDPEHPAAFGTTPPAAHLSTVEYKVQLEEASERFAQHFIFGHHINDEFFPYVPAGENIKQFNKVDGFMSTYGSETLKRVKDEYCDSPEKIVSSTFNSWFERELQYYRHYEIYKETALDDLLDEHFKEAIRNNYTLTEKEKEWKLNFEVQSGHAISLITKNMNSVGCGLSRRTEYVSEVNYHGKLAHQYFFQDLIVCKFGGACPSQGKVIYDIDENLLHMHDISKSVYDLPDD